MRAELVRQTIDEAMRMLYADDWTPEDRDEIEASLAGIPGEIDRLIAENERLREALEKIAAYAGTRDFSIPCEVIASNARDALEESSP